MYAISGLVNLATKTRKYILTCQKIQRKLSLLCNLLPGWHTCADLAVTKLALSDALSSALECVVTPLLVYNKVTMYAIL